MTAPENVRLLTHTPDHIRALMAGGQEYEQRFGIRVAQGLQDFFLGPEVSEAFLARMREKPAPDPWRDGFGVLELTENCLIGVCGFNGPPDADSTVEIAYGIAPGYQGRGYATAAAALLIAHAFVDPRVRRIRAHTLPEENASTGVLRKCGFNHYHQVEHPVDGTIWRWEMDRADCHDSRQG